MRSQALLLLLCSLSVAIQFESALAAGPTQGERRVKVGADKPVVLSDAAIDKDLLVLENRFFFHSYAHDPLEKRLERIELLALGNVQYGTNQDRLSRLKAAIVERDRQAAREIAGQSKGGNYPMISTLEWRVLKKTFTSESIDQRLDRLEKSIFGMPAQAMSYVDRIERLKKTVGIGLPAPEPIAGAQAGGRRGPMPRSGGLNGDGQEFGAGGSGLGLGSGFGFGSGLGSGLGSGSNTGQGQSGADSGWGYGFSFSVGPDGKSEFKEYKQRPYTPLPQRDQGRSMPNYPNFPNFPNSPGNAHLDPSGGANGPVGLSELMERMQRNMNDMMKQFSSVPIFEDPDFEVQPVPDFSERDHGLNQSGPLPKKKIDIPANKKRVTPRDELPPYSDPNSI